MSIITFKKSSFGGKNAQTGGIIAIVFGLIILFSGKYGFIATIILVLYGIFSGFGKQMVDIDFENGTINQYVQILFFKTKSVTKIPPVDYLLVRDFNGYTVDSENYQRAVSYYEFSFVMLNKRPRMVLAFCPSRQAVHNLVALFKANSEILIKDGTREKLLG